MIFYGLLILIIILAIGTFFKSNSIENFVPLPYYNIVNNMSSQFTSDNLSLNRFFNFSGISSRFYPETKKIVNKYYKVPLVV